MENIRENQHECDICGEEFNRRRYKRRHEQSVHNIEYKFECQFCQKWYKYKDSLNKHIGKKHLNEEISIYKNCEKHTIHEEKKFNRKLEVKNLKIGIDPEYMQILEMDLRDTINEGLASWDMVDSEFEFL